MLTPPAEERKQQRLINNIDPSMDPPRSHNRKSGARGFARWNSIAALQWPAAHTRQSLYEARKWIAGADLPGCVAAVHSERLNVEQSGLFSGARFMWLPGTARQGRQVRAGNNAVDSGPVIFGERGAKVHGDAQMAKSNGIGKSVFAAEMTLTLCRMEQRQLAQTETRNGKTAPPM